MKKIVLYNPQGDRIYWKKGHPPLPLMAISSFLDREGYDIKIFDHTEKAALMSNIEGCICAGITCMTGHQIRDGLFIARMIRNKYPHIPIVWGGWHPTILPGQTIQNELVDIIGRGQGERTFTELVKALESKSDLSKIPGITYKKDGEIISNPDRPFEDANNFPPLPFHLLDIEKYVAKTRLGKRTIGYITSYGCPFRCGFCAEQRVHHGEWNALTAERVVADMRNLVMKYNVDSIIISDSNFFVDEKRVRGICEGVKELHIAWGQVNGRTNLARYKPETWRLMEESRLQYILTGAESGTEDCLKIIKKGATVQDTLDFTRVAERYNVRIQFSLFIGTPGLEGRGHSVKDEFYSTLDLIYQLHRINKNNEFLLFVYAPYPGTPLYDTARQLGFKEPSKFEEWGNFDLNIKHIPWVPDKYANLTWDLTFYLFFISGSLRRTISRYPVVIRLFLMIAAMPFYFIIWLRFKSKFFLVPFEVYAIRFVLRAKNRIQGICDLKFKRRKASPHPEVPKNE